MFKYKIFLNETSDVNSESATIRKKAKQYQLPDATIDSLIDEFVGVAVPLIKSARSMQSQGSGLNVTRSFKGPGYDIKLKFILRNSQSIYTRIVSFIGGIRGS